MLSLQSLQIMRACGFIAADHVDREKQLLNFAGARPALMRRAIEDAVEEVDAEIGILAQDELKRHGKAGQQASAVPSGPTPTPPPAPATPPAADGKRTEKKAEKKKARDGPQR